MFSLITHTCKSKYRKLSELHARVLCYLSCKYDKIRISNDDKGRKFGMRTQNVCYVNSRI